MILYFPIDNLRKKTFVVNNIKLFMELPFHINAGSETMEIKEVRSLTVRSPYCRGHEYCESTDQDRQLGGADESAMP